MGKRAFVPELESLRGLAALAVSLCHVFMAGAVFAKPFADFRASDWEQYVLTTLTSSEGAVAIFFVLSGLVLSQGFRIERYGARDYAAFLVRRVFRIMPTVAVAVLVCQFIRAEYFGVHVGWWHIYGAIALDMTQIDIDPPLWSLNVEMAMMLVFPLLVLVNARLSGMVQIVPLYLLIGLVPWGIGGVFAFHFAFCFQLGIMAPHLASAIGRLPARAATALLAIALLAVMVPTNLSFHGVFKDLAESIGSNPQVTGWIEADGHILLEGAGAAYLVAYTLARKGAWLTMFLSLAPCRALGRLSFPIYLLNYPLVSLSSAWLGAHIGTPAQFSVWFALLTAGLMLALNLSGAAILHYAVELPFQILGRKLAAATVSGDSFAILKLLDAPAQGLNFCNKQRDKLAVIALPWAKIPVAGLCVGPVSRRHGIGKRPIFILRDEPDVAVAGIRGKGIIDDAKPIKDRADVALTLGNDVGF